jgi:hypothetical protein
MTIYVQGRIKLFGAPRQWNKFRPLFHAVFLSGGGGGGIYMVIWPCWCFHGRYYFYSLKFTVMLLNERKRNANNYLISNFDRLETAPSNLPP